MELLVLIILVIIIGVGCWAGYVALWALLGGA